MRREGIHFHADSAGDGGKVIRDGLADRLSSHTARAARNSAAPFPNSAAAAAPFPSKELPLSTPSSSSRDRLATNYLVQVGLERLFMCFTMQLLIIRDANNCRCYFV